MIRFEKFEEYAKKYNPLNDQGKVFVSKRSLKKARGRSKKYLAFEDDFFDGEEFKAISRSSIFKEALNFGKDKDDAYEHDLERFILLVLYWGFPTNAHGECKRVYKSLPDVKEFASELFEDPSNAQAIFDKIAYRKCHKKKYLYKVGIAFLSKLFYFSTNGNFVILDQFVALGISKVESVEIIRELIDCTKDGRYRNCKNYSKYIEGMNKLSRSLKVEKYKLEYAFWLIGKFC